MPTTRRMLATAALTLTLGGALTASSAANSIWNSSQQFRLTWNPATLSGAGIEVRCNITLEGSFHSRTITKSAGALTGNMTRADLARPCTGGTAWLLNGREVNEVLGGTMTNSLPWHIVYRGFSGTLPNITSIRFDIIGLAVQVRATIFGISALCLYRSNTSWPATVVANVSRTGAISSVEFSNSSLILETGPFGCPNTLSLIGNGSAQLPEGTNSVFVALV